MSGEPRYKSFAVNMNDADLDKLNDLARWLNISKAQVLRDGLYELHRIHAAYYRRLDALKGQTRYFEGDDK